MSPTVAAGRREAVAAAVVALVLSAVVSFAPPPGADVFNAALHDFGHVVVFAAIGFALARAATARAAPPRGRVLTPGAIVVGLALGALTEGVQALAGGWFSRGDVVRDVAGTLAGVAVVLLRRPGTLSRRLTAALLAGLAASALLAILPLAGAAAAYLARERAFPALADAAIPRALRFVREGYSSPRTVEIPAPWSRTPGERAIELSLERGPWPGLTVAEPAPDWRGWRALAIDVVNPGDEPIELALRIDDDRPAPEYRDRYQGSRTLPARARATLEVPLADIAAGPRQGPPLDLGRIRLVIVFHDGPLPGRRVLVRRIELLQ